jgi:ketosteroid isomerase-like protein
MATATQPDPRAAIERLAQAINDHNVDAMLSVFDPDYRSEQPAHPDRGFQGVEQVRKNWSAIFNSTADFSANLRAVVVEGDTVWSEWDWSGTRTDGSRLQMRGVILNGVRDGRIMWARLYMEPVEQAGAGIDQAVATMTSGSMSR